MIMKKYLNILFLFPLFLYSCQGTEVDELFDQSPEERVAAQLEQMKSDLVNASYGWTVYYRYANLANEDYFNILFKDNGQAIINYPLGDGTVGSETTTYTLRYTQQIDLVFDTYSVFASIVGNAGGDFRFEFSKREGDNIYFNARNDATEGTGVFELSKTETENEYADLVVLQAKMVDNPAKSFYRVLTLDNGSKYLMNVMSMKLAWLEWTTVEEIFREKYELILTDEGFKLKTPIQADGISITKFIAKDDGSFEAWSETGKVGTLDYGLKPFNYPNSLSMLLDESANYFYIAEQYSQAFGALINELKAADPSYTHLQFYLGSDFIAYFRSSASVRWMQYGMKFQFAADAIGMSFDGGTSPGADDYLDLAIKSFLQIHNKSFTIVPRDGLFYLVQDQNPEIWMILEPQ